MSEREPRRVRVAPREVDRDDVDDVVGIAAELAEEEKRAEAKVSVGELEEIAEELRIPSKHVEPALDVLGKRREEAAKQASARRARIKTALIGSVTALAVGLSALGLGVTTTTSALSGPRAAVDRQRAQVETVIERRERIEARLEGAPPSLDRDAELIGAENRVAIERRRYDEAASAYNTLASEAPRSFFCTIAGVPCRVPLSSEVAGW